MHIQAKDKITSKEMLFNAEALHGRAEIALTDVNTGKTEVIRHDNIVTNAVRNLLRDNYHGTLDVSKLEPLRDLFGGVLCFGSTNTASVDNIIPPNDDANRLIAHAGQTGHATANPLRGVPNGVESGEITGGYKFVWDFLTSQGNGTISSLSLTHKEFGDVGLKPFDNSLSTVFDSGLHINNIPVKSAAITRDVAIRNPRKFDTSTGEAISIWQTTNTFEEITSQYSTSKLFLNNEYMIPIEKSNRTATLTRSFTDNYSAVVEDSTNYYVVEVQTNGSSSVYMNTINKTTFAVTNTSFTATGASLLRQSVATNQLTRLIQHPYFACDGTYLYIASTDFTFYRISLANTADVTKLTSNLTAWISSTNYMIGMRAINEKLLVGHNWLINGDYVYATARNLPSPTSPYFANDSFTGGNYPNALTQGQSIGTGNFNSWLRVVTLPYLATINNLDTAVTKSSSQTMKITYSITEA